MINVCELKWLLKALTSIIIFDFHGRAIKIKRDESLLNALRIFKRCANKRHLNEFMEKKKKKTPSPR